MENTKNRTSNVFIGCTIVATGKLEHFTRDGINTKIASVGATAANSVTSKTNYLICGEKTGSKLEKARKLGIPVLTEQEFLDMVSV
jgi:DNA ligase (NAD+)